MQKTWFDDFYPTPRALAQDMLSGIDFTKMSCVLEPSAGKGDLADAIAEKVKYTWFRSRPEMIDCIEISPELQGSLVAKGFRVIHDDFLTLDTLKRYDAIVMNPPFSNGDAHLLKALSMMQHGGEISCLLNAETLRNPCTDRRAELVRQLNNLGARITYKQNAFASAERRTGVEIAIVRVSIPKSGRESIIFDDLKKADVAHGDRARAAAPGIATSDLEESLMQQFLQESKLGIALVDEFDIARSIIGAERHELKLLLDGREATPNAFLKSTRLKYWRLLFNSKDISGVFTTNLVEEYTPDLERLADFDFSPYNIGIIRMALMAKVTHGIEDTILAMFDKLSCVYHYDESTQGFQYAGQDHQANTHYFNGWKTNKSWYVNKRVIIPFYGVWDGWNDRFKPTSYKVVRALADIEKCFNYLDSGRTESVDLAAKLMTAEAEKQTRKIDTKYFLVTFYKNGTAHLEFKDLELLQKFNIFGSQKRGWLPPSYGKKRYKDLDDDAKSVVDSFQGKEAYEKVVANSAFYIADATQFLLLPTEASEVEQ